jgi:hypothetical protein
MDKTPDVLERMHELVARVDELCSQDAIRECIYRIKAFRLLRARVR